MDQPTFRPVSAKPATDSVFSTLFLISQYSLILVGGLAAILFLPMLFMPIIYTKLLLVIYGVGIASVIFCLTVLRTGSLTLRLSVPLLLFGLVIAVTAASALFSGDMRDSFVGNFFEAHSVAFLLLLGVIMVAVSMFRNQKRSVIRLYGLIVFSAVLLSIFHALRLVVGPDFLSLGIFTTTTATPLAGWNDLALYFGLTILVCQLTVSHLPLTRAGKFFIWVVVAIALLMLAVINFFTVWIVLGLISFVTLVYLLTQKKGQQLTLTEEKGSAVHSIAMSLIISAAAIMFVFGGSSLAAVINQFSGAEHTEVRPSYSATFDVARQVLDTSPLLGVGPNRFVDAWRMYKDPSINQTIFWNTPFRSGTSYLTTNIVETGILGTIVWIGFFLSLMYTGFRMLTATIHVDNFWRFVGLSSFVSAVYLWGMSVVYVPNQTTLIFAALCTGVFLLSASTILPERTTSVAFGNNKSLGFIFVTALMVVIVVVVASLYYVTLLFGNINQFNKAIASVESGDSLEDLTQEISLLFEEVPNDVYVRQIALYELAQLRSLINISDPTPEQQQVFQSALVRGVNSGQVATQADPTEMVNWQVLGEIYLTLGQAGVEGATDRAEESFIRARELAPTNPVLVLRLAEVSIVNGDLASARTLLSEAIRLQPRYTEAIFLLTQLDVQEGNLEQAIAGTRGIISLEPDNPVRRYQLGILLASNNQIEASIAAFEQAVALDSEYANARYYLAVQYSAVGRVEEAIAQLEIIRDLNPQNSAVTEVISALRDGSIAGPLAPEADTVGVLEGDGEAAAETVTAEDLDSNLVSSVNIIPDDTEPETAEVVSSGNEIAE